ncbi:MAG TPA: helix-turn-helix domain-containing protein [Candidatus Eisenbergiella merdavium]|uniref:Helix-turn-helix domain-containing protein n=1 Tax=Candidatus Eisenbergiella merdavium TaxID=2838551 RepID=A0A9D2NFX4_9FIRM|nr:helix-turn-helix domain-containing protein [Candidatus Eisenbergiella merdavium]
MLPEEKLRKNLADNLHFLRFSRNPKISQQTLAEKIGTSQKSISRYEQGICLPPAHILTALADYFGLPVDALLQDPHTPNGSLLRLPKERKEPS